MPLKVNEYIILNEDDVEFKFSRSSGPGGQNVNKVESAVTLKFNVMGSSIPEDIKKRILESGDKRINSEGCLLISSGESRSQLMNRKTAIDKLINFLRDISKTKRKRIKTQISKSAKEERIASKKHRSEVKKQRARISKNDFQKYL
ncbi:MAG: alternative ribosome rescue aminoacyl-tRNA hydrolase ArfB [Candidatus Kapaibacterium sp.]